jgi:hypothetical protein
MQTQNTLGLFISKGQATGVCVHFKGHTRTTQGGFRVTVDPAEPEPFQALAKQIAQACSEKKLRFTETVVALDCALFMQHGVHSEFDNPKQIAATIRYDTEEVVATDVSTMAVSFQVLSTDESGANLAVYTAAQSVLQDLVHALQGQDMDPIDVEPDVCSLARFVRRHQTGSKSDGYATLVGVLSRQHGYFLRSGSLHQVLPIRAFVIGPQQNRAEILTREAFTTMASASGEPIKHMVAYDSSGQVKASPVAGRLGLEVTEADWFKTDQSGLQTLLEADGEDPVAYAIAFGAGLAHEDKIHTANLRNDFLPFQGKRLRLHSAMRWTSISVAVLLIAIGAHLQMRLMQVNKDLVRVKERVSKDYSTVMKGKLPGNKNPVEELKREVRRVKDIKSGELNLQESVMARLGLVLKAFGASGQAGLRIDSLDITTKTISVTGSTPREGDTKSFFKTLRDNGLDIPKDTVALKADRSTFNIYLEPNKKASGDKDANASSDKKVP